MGPCLPPHMDTRTIPILAALACLGVLTPAYAAMPPTVPVAGEDVPLPSLAPMIKKVAPAIVNIATRGNVRERLPQNPLLDDPAFQRFFAVPQPQSTRVPPFQSAGSGVIFDAKRGYILTNAHVIENASEITVTLADGRDLRAEIVGTDEPTDLAVLRVKPVRLSEIQLGDSSKLEVGDFVVAIGNPFGLQNTVTSGIVSGLGRSSLETDGYEDFIQTDASINPGNSGGALVNLRGDLVGISTAILARDGNRGIGFAIPVNMARSIADQLLQFGSVKRGLLGIDTYPVSPDVAQALGLPGAQGALVTQVLAGSSAETAGIASGDVVISLNHVTVKSPADLRNTVALMRAGDTVDIGLLRNGRMRYVSVLIAAPPEVQPADVRPGDINPGLDGATLSDAPAGGVLVRSVDPGSAAAAIGLHADDVIIGINQARVKHLAQLRARAAGATTLVLEVQRGRGVVLVPVVSH